MTTCAKALQAWAAKEETPLEDAKMVKIYAQIPPISKLDNSLNQLVNCERLSLSTNSIDRLIPLPGLKSLKILSVGRNNLKKVQEIKSMNVGAFIKIASTQHYTLRTT